MLIAHGLPTRTAEQGRRPRESAVADSGNNGRPAPNPACTSNGATEQQLRTTCPPRHLADTPRVQTHHSEPDDEFNSRGHLRRRNQPATPRCPGKIAFPGKLPAGQNPAGRGNRSARPGPRRILLVRPPMSTSLGACLEIQKRFILLALSRTSPGLVIFLVRVERSLLVAWHTIFGGPERTGKKRIYRRNPGWVHDTHRRVDATGHHPGWRLAGPHRTQLGQTTPNDRRPTFALAHAEASLWGTSIQCTRRRTTKLFLSEQTNNGQRPGAVTNREELVAQSDPRAGYIRRRHRRTPQSLSFVSFVTTSKYRQACTRTRPRGRAARRRLAPQAATLQLVVIDSRGSPPGVRCRGPGQAAGGGNRFPRASSTLPLDHDHHVAKTHQATEPRRDYPPWAGSRGTHLRAGPGDYHPLTPYPSTRTGERSPGIERMNATPRTPGSPRTAVLGQGVPSPPDARTTARTRTEKQRQGTGKLPRTRASARIKGSPPPRANPEEAPPGKTRTGNEAGSTAVAPLATVLQSTRSPTGRPWTRTG